MSQETLNHVMDFFSGACSGCGVALAFVLLLEYIREAKKQ